MKSCLLVIDYTVKSCTEELFDNKLLKCREIAPRLVFCVDQCRKEGIEVVWVKCKPWTKEFLAKNLVDLYESDSAARYYGENDRSDNFYKISPEKGEAIFEKNTYSAFSGTQGQLEKYLKKIKIKKIYVSGIYTTGCVEATLVEAFARGFHVQVVEDCVETFDNEHPQKLQSLLLENWRYLYGKHTNSKQIKA